MSLSIDQLHPLVLNVGLAVHNADWNWQHVNSPFMRMYYVTEGTAQVKLPDGVQILRPDHLYWIPAFTNHSYICNSYFCHYYIHIYEEPSPDGDILDEWDFPIEIPACEIDLALIKRLCDINPHMVLPQSDPSTYDNDSTLMQNLLRNKQRAWCDKVESRGIVFQLLSRFIKQAQSKASPVGAGQYLLGVLFQKRSCPHDRVGSSRPARMRVFCFIDSYYTMTSPKRKARRHYREA